MPDGGLMRIGEAAKLIGVSPMTLRRLADRGKIRCFQIGPLRERRFAREDVLSLIREREVRASEGGER
jgi:excisionase family DNA binding protein